MRESDTRVSCDRRRAWCLPLFTSLAFLGATVLLLQSVGAQSPAPMAAADSARDSVPGSWVRVPVSRDTSVSSVAGETEGSNGAARTVKLKSLQELILLDFESEALAGQIIAAGRLHLHPASDVLLHRVTVASLADSWSEGDGVRYQRRRGASSFWWSKTGTQRWGSGAIDITAVTLGIGGSVWGFSDASALDERGFQEIEVDPKVIAARLAGLSTGFVVMDDVGSEYRRNGDEFIYSQFPNRVVHAREAEERWRPYFTVRVAGTDTEPPESVGNLEVSSGQGSLAERQILTWSTPKDRGKAGVLGYEIRLGLEDRLDWDSARPWARVFASHSAETGEINQLVLSDLPREPGGPLKLAIRTVDAAGNRGPVSVVALASPVTEERAPLEMWTPPEFARSREALYLGAARLAVIDPLDKPTTQDGTVIPPHPLGYLNGNHLWSAQRRLIRLFGARGEFVSLQLALWDLREDLRLCVAFDPADQAASPSVRWYRAGWVETVGDGPSRLLPDPLYEVTGAPAEGCWELSARDLSSNPTALLADVFVPADTAPGVYSGTLQLSTSTSSVDLRIELRVWGFRLPDVLSFVPQLNSYRLPGSPGSQLEREFYRLAHAHRTCLNRLSYNWKGQVGAGLAPQIRDGRLAFDDWDRDFGPLLDGSAFADLPRGTVPVEAFYLPLNENWPVAIEPHFRGGYWADTALDQDYWQEFERWVGEFAQHLAARGWDQTLFEFYLNNKLTYKKRRGSWDGSSALWIFDEPLHTQDFWALRQYGLAFRRGLSRALSLTEQGSEIGGSGGPSAAPQLVYRVDISRPQWQRDILDGVVDVNVVSHVWRHYHRRIRDHKERFGERLYNYGSANDVDTSNGFLTAWCIDAWSLGADGIVPWQTIGRADSYQNADRDALMYPPQQEGSMVPLPSIRLKALRRGQQDVEYLTILTASSSIGRWELARQIRSELGMVDPTATTLPIESLISQLENVDPVDLWRLRVKVGQLLDGLRPEDRRRWVRPGANEEGRRVAEKPSGR